MSSDLIASDAALADLCRALEGSAWIALDTEFLRERTYYARLCLVQVGAPGIVACIDPLALEQLDRCMPCSKTRACARCCMPRVRTLRSSTT